MLSKQAVLPFWQRAGWSWSPAEVEYTQCPKSCQLLMCLIGLSYTFPSKRRVGKGYDKDIHHLL